MDDVARRVSDVAREVLLADAPVVFAVLHGSRVDGTSREDSDVDLALLLRDDVPAGDYLDLQLDLTSRLSRAAGVANVDLVILNDAALLLRGRVVSGGVVIHSADELARADYESNTFREFVDFQIAFAGFDRELLRRIANGTR